MAEFPTVLQEALALLPPTEEGQALGALLALATPRVLTLILA